MDKLFKIAGILFVLSFSFLVFIFYTYDIHESSVLDLGEDFKVKGQVISLYQNNKTVSMKIMNEFTIDAFFFTDGKDYSEMKGKEVIASGHMMDDSYLLDEIKLYKP